jgi:hypothetical protein
MAVSLLAQALIKPPLEDDMVRKLRFDLRPAFRPFALRPHRSINAELARFFIGSRGPRFTLRALARCYRTGHAPTGIFSLSLPVPVYPRLRILARLGLRGRLNVADQTLVFLDGFDLITGLDSAFAREFNTPPQHMNHYSRPAREVKQS